jgi:Type III restriction enzyme, res subunit
MTESLEDVVPLNSMINLSKRVSEDVEGYHHCEYQAAVAAIALSHSNPFVVVVSPTGSGKTWIQGLIAKYYCNHSKRVTVVEPNEILRIQTAEKLGFVDFGITVVTIENLYSEGPWGDVLILNEYDTIVNETPYCLHGIGLSGLWQFKNRRVFAFSATSSPPYERLVNNCIGMPTVLKFKSEYELVHGTSPIQEALIRQVSSKHSLISMVEEDINKTYDHKPVVIIHEADQEGGIMAMIERSKWKFATGVTQGVLSKVRHWDYGILLLKPSEGRGVDTRFQKDAMVLIASEVHSYHELQQMIGRSSRTRGVCEGVLYNKGDETTVQVIDRLKRQNVSVLQDLERLMLVLEKRDKDQGLLKHLKKEKENG